MRSLTPVALLICAACSVETVDSGRPPGPPTAADSLARLEQDSAATAQVQAALNLYYRRFAARDWRGYRQSFWPGAIVTTRSQADGEGAATVAAPLDEFLQNAPQRVPRLSAVSDTPVHQHINAYGDVATAWVVYRAVFSRSDAAADTVHGIDAFQLIRQGSRWRITSLSFTPEVPGRPLSVPAR